MSNRRNAALQHVAGLAIAFTPFAVCLLSGALHTSLWLDEIVYWDYERHPMLRGADVFRPGSHLAPWFTSYFFCDIQRVVHAILPLFGLTLRRDPELYLRFLPVVAFVALIATIYFVTWRRTREWWWSVTAALLAGASPLLLFYTFEARVPEFASAALIATALLLTRALERPLSRRACIAGALASIVLCHLLVWLMCFFAGIAAAAVVRWLFVRANDELRTALAFSIPGAITAVAESKFITLTNPPGGHTFPLHAAQPWFTLAQRTLLGAFSLGFTAYPRGFRLFQHGPTFPLLALVIAVALLIAAQRRSPHVILAVAPPVALALTVIIGSRYGYLIIPRYQVPLFAAMLLSLTFADTRSVRIAAAIVVAFELLLLPMTVEQIASKANSREIAALIDHAPRDGSVIIVQHPIRLGFPDPLQNYTLHFYLDEIQPERPPLHIVELPALRDITEQEGVLRYFVGGAELLAQYSAAPAVQWRAQLAAAPWTRVWFVSPVPANAAEEEQSAAFRQALHDSGFMLRGAKAFDGYPRTLAGLFERTPSRILRR